MFGTGTDHCKNGNHTPYLTGHWKQNVPLDLTAVLATGEGTLAGLGSW